MHFLTSLARVKLIVSCLYFGFFHFEFPPNKFYNNLKQQFEENRRELYAHKLTDSNCCLILSTAGAPQFLVFVRLLHRSVVVLICFEFFL